MRAVTPADGCGGAVFESAGTRPGALLRREMPGAGARPHAAGAAPEDGSGRDPDARLQAPRHYHTERLRRGVFTSVPELIGAIKGYVAHHNENPKPFIWTAKAMTSCRRSSAPIAG